MDMNIDGHMKAWHCGKQWQIRGKVQGQKWENIYGQILEMFWTNGGNISGQMVKTFMGTRMLGKWWKIRGGEREEPQEVATDGYYFCIKMHLLINLFHKLLNT